MSGQVWYFGFSYLALFGSLSRIFSQCLFPDLFLSFFQNLPGRSHGPRFLSQSFPDSRGCSVSTGFTSAGLKMWSQGLLHVVNDRME